MRVPALGRSSEPGEKAMLRRVAIAQGKMGIDYCTLLDYGAGNRVATNVMGVVGFADLVIGYDIQDGTPVPCGPFDAVTSFEVLEHAPSEAGALLEMHSALKSGGVLFLTVPNRWWIFETHGCWWPGPWNRVPFIGWLPRWIHHRIARARNYTRGEIVERLSVSGFMVHASGYVRAAGDIVRPSWLRGWLQRGLLSENETDNPLLAASVWVLAHKI